MNTNALMSNAKLLVCVAALAACAFSIPVRAQDRAQGQDVTVKISVSRENLDFSQPSGASALYHRFQKAAFIVCRGGDRVDLRPVDSFADCYEKAIADAVRSANQPQLTIVYLKTHSAQSAAARGIEVPALVAAK